MYNYSEVSKTSKNLHTCILGINVNGTSIYPYEVNFQTPVLRCVKEISIFPTTGWNRLSFNLSDHDGTGHDNTDFADVSLAFTYTGTTLKDPKAFTIAIHDVPVFNQDDFADIVVNYIHLHHPTLDIKDYVLSQAIFTFTEV